MKNINKFDLALSVGKNSVLDETKLSDMQKAGICAVELSFYDYMDVDFKKIKSDTENFGIELWSLHLPFVPFDKIDISSTNSDIRNHSVETIKDIISRAKTPDAFSLDTETSKNFSGVADTLTVNKVKLLLRQKDFLFRFVNRFLVRHRA